MITPFKKEAVIRAFLEHFEQEISALSESAKAAHEASTHEESKQEDKHDTRATEASYLAVGQAKRVAALEQVRQEFLAYQSGYRACTHVEPGALIKLKMGGISLYSFVAIGGGGEKIHFDDKSISILSSSSPLGEALTGFRVGDETELESKAGTKIYFIESLN